MGTILVLSPHLDDAVFSCEGLIRGQAEAGAKVIVATVFSQGDREHSWRRKEDLAAASRLGFETIHLDFVDAPFRERGHQGYRELLYGWNEDDEAAVVDVAHSLQGLCASLRPSRLLAPLAVGAHVDHRILFEAVIGTACSQAAEFYEDRPYAYARGAAELRLSQLGAPDTRFDRALLLSDWSNLSFVRVFAPRGEPTLDFECAPPLARKDTIVTAESSLLECDPPTAASCYESQYRTFCDGGEMHKYLDRRYSVFLGSNAARCERRWRLSFQPVNGAG